MQSIAFVLPRRCPRCTKVQLECLRLYFYIKKYNLDEVRLTCNVEDLTRHENLAAGGLSSMHKDFGLYQLIYV
jgi:hypothetical protein